MTAKDVKFGADARERMLRGVDILANAASGDEMNSSAEQGVATLYDSCTRELPVLTAFT